MATALVELQPRSPVWSAVVFCPVGHRAGSPGHRCGRKPITAEGREVGATDKGKSPARTHEAGLPQIKEMNNGKLRRPEKAS